jgi:adenine-specific DNA-methyltransferase
VPRYEGRLELTWTNKHQRLLAHDDGSYEWLPPSDHRVAEVRLLHALQAVGQVGPQRAGDNLLIRGDALHALTSLAKLPEFASSCVGQVELAYLDPPFNTGQAFPQYDDALEHSVWLTMLRDRLLQIYELLSPTGSVWVHCDDSEQHRLRLVMDEVFGPECFAGTLVWRSSDNSNNDAKKFSTDHNYLIVYGKDENWTSRRLQPQASQVAHYSNPDGDPNGSWFDGNPLNSPNPRENLRYSITSPTGYEIPAPPNGWRWSRSTLQAKIDAGEIRFTADGKGIRRRTYLRDHKGLPSSSLWVHLEETGHNRQAKAELKRLFPGIPTSALFATPKPERLLKKIIELTTAPGDLVLDCFAGSGTTAAVAQKMGRAWVAVEREAETVRSFTAPRLQKVVEGDDDGGVTNLVGWTGGGGFRVLEIAPSMFESDGGLVYLADEMTNGDLAEATAAQLGYQYKPEPPFAGLKGRTRLAVVDGVVNEGVVRLLVSALGEDERVVICGTGLDPEARPVLRELRPGSSLRKIPAALLERYRAPQRRVRREAPGPTADPVLTGTDA